MAKNKILWTVRLNKISLIEGTINRTNNDLGILREKQSKDTNFRSRANWSERGEKSNKYFLNLNKKYKKQKLIGKIICDDVIFKGQNEVNIGITDYYRKLYSKNAVEEGDEEFYNKN